MSTPLKDETLLQWLDDQSKWIASHGGDLAGYVRRYGSVNEPLHYGDGGEAIYAADIGAMERLMKVALRRKLFRRGI